MPTFLIFIAAAGCAAGAATAPDRWLTASFAAGAGFCLLHLARSIRRAA